MARRNKNTLRLSPLILLKEVFDSKIKTQFKEVQYSDHISYEFETKSGENYDLEFFYSEEKSDTTLDNGENLGSILGTTETKVPCFDISFTLSNVIDKDNPDEFEIDSNKQEQFELFGRISYIIDVIVKKYKKVDLFVIGGARRNRMDIYKKMFMNSFSNDFDVYFGESQYHPAIISMFVIRKK